MSFITGLNIVLSFIAVMTIVANFEIELKQMWEFLWSPLARITIGVKVDCNVKQHKALFSMPATISNDNTNWDFTKPSINQDDIDTEPMEWEPVSDDSDPVLFNGTIVPKEAIAVESLQFFGEEVQEFYIDELIDMGPVIKNRRFSTYMADCDIMPSAKCPINWVESIKGVVRKDPITGLKTDFYWL